MEGNFRPTRALIYLDNLKSNILEIKKLLKPETKLMGVVKADAYGHGAVEIAKKALEYGVDYLAVAYCDEGIQLREAGIKDTKILVLGFTPKEQIEDSLKNNLTLTVFTNYDAQKIAEISQKLGKTTKVHIKIDTGMGRLGYLPQEESINSIKELANMPGINIEGIFTHFACADEKDKTHTLKQFEKYKWVLKRLKEEKINIPIKHVANSATIIDFPEMHLDMVRAGLTLYGRYPSEDVRKERLNLKPVMKFKTGIAHIKTLPEKCTISYGATFTTKKETKVATLPIGYADGFNRLLSNKGEVLIKGKRAPVLGRVCMDQIIVDVSEIEGVTLEDEVIIFGKQGSEEITVEEVALKTLTINFEVLCSVSKRVPRIYIE